MVEGITGVVAIIEEVMAVWLIEGVSWLCDFTLLLLLMLPLLLCRPSVCQSVSLSVCLFVPHLDPSIHPSIWHGTALALAFFDGTAAAAGGDSLDGGKCERDVLQKLAEISLSNYVIIGKKQFFSPNGGVGELSMLYTSFSSPYPTEGCWWTMSMTGRRMNATTTTVEIAKSC